MGSANLSSKQSDHLTLICQYMVLLCQHNCLTTLSEQQLGALFSVLLFPNDRSTLVAKIFEYLTCTIHKGALNFLPSNAQTVTIKCQFSIDPPQVLLKCVCQVSGYGVYTDECIQNGCQLHLLIEIGWWFGGYLWSLITSDLTRQDWSSLECEGLNQLETLNLLVTKIVWRCFYCDCTIRGGVGAAVDRTWLCSPSQVTISIVESSIDRSTCFLAGHPLMLLHLQ